MAAIQMNTRIDAELKSAGDSVFEAVGYTPTRVVRAVWEFAQRNQAKPEVVEELLREAEGANASEAEERERKARLAEAGPAVFESFLHDAGVDNAPALGNSGLSPAEVRERAAVERALQKGWIDG